MLLLLIFNFIGFYTQILGDAYQDLRKLEIDLEMNNRFSVLYFDDEQNELSPPVECVPNESTKKTSIPSPTSAFTKVETDKKVTDKKSSEKKKQGEFRDFGTIHTHQKKDMFQKRNPFRKSIGSRYAFKDDHPHKPLVSPIQAPYKFIDEAVPLEPFQSYIPSESLELKDSQTIESQTIIFSSTIGNRVSSEDCLTSLPL